MNESNRPSQWELWWAWFEFDDGRRGKRRPVIIGDITDDGYAIIYVTTKVEKTWFPDYVPLEDWRIEGLPRQSAARAWRVQRVPLKVLEKRIGLLSPHDRMEVQMRFMQRRMS